MAGFGKQLHAYHLVLLWATAPLLITFTPLRRIPLLQQLTLLSGAVAILGIILTLILAIAFEGKAAYWGKLSCCCFALLLTSGFCIRRGGELDDAARLSVCVGNLKKIHAALLLYAKDNDGCLVPENDPEVWKILVAGGYLRSGEPFRCPTSPRAEREVTYRYFGGHSLDAPRKTVILEDDDRHPDGCRPRVSLDGTVSF